MVKEIIFDCFGVLTEDGWLAFMRQFETKENTEELRYLNHQADRGLIAYEDLLRQVVALTKATREQAHTIITTTHHPNKELFAYIEQLKQRGYELGVISNVGSKLDTYLPGELLQIFDRLTLSYDVGVIKPEPGIYEAHLAKSGWQPSEVVFIDDREVNCTGAAQLGITTIHYKSFEQMRTALEPLLIL